ncbi:MAG: MTAP family purine nucleoside phosphorylase [Solirubrobacterales bacterium]
MGWLGLIVGSGLLGHEPELAGAEVLQRHGSGEYVPAHRIDHAANLRGLVERGCERVLAISAVGSLDEDLGIGSLLCPDDFIALHLGCSAFLDERGHRVPGFDPDWRRAVLGSCSAAGLGPIVDGGTYWQALGPRFETPAEIRLISPHADVIGMTVAAECIVAGELGLPYAALCTVDNLANGVGPQPLTVGEYEAGREANRERLEEALPALLEALEVAAR